MIVADASWVVALSDPSDRHHRRAAAVNQEIASEDALLHPVTLAECLVAPARTGTADEAHALLRAAFDIDIVEVDAPLRWARLRAETRLRLPDVIVLDTAMNRHARAIATFDEQLRACTSDHGLEVLGPDPS